MKVLREMNIMHDENSFNIIYTECIKKIKLSLAYNIMSCHYKLFNLFTIYIL